MSEYRHRIIRGNKSTRYHDISVHRSVLLEELEERKEKKKVEIVKIPVSQVIREE